MTAAGTPAHDRHEHGSNHGIELGPRGEVASRAPTKEPEPPGQKHASGTLSARLARAQADRDAGTVEATSTGKAPTRRGTQPPEPSPPPRRRRRWRLR